MVDALAVERVTRCSELMSLRVGARAGELLPVGPRTALGTVADPAEWDRRRDSEVDLWGFTLSSRLSALAETSVELESDNFG